ncbi:MAG: SGNH/GDSL hydrolase family protein [Phycisphaerae bacterium]
MLLEPNDHVLFYGDSITDVGRRSCGEKLGGGYPRLLASQLAADLPDWELTFTNTGISGNRIYDLEERLEEDLLAHRPTLVSILIGINDTWRRYDRDVVSPIEEFDASYRRILQRIDDELSAKIVVLEPFLLPVPEAKKQWREDLDPRIQAVREIARDTGATFVPLDGLFAAASCRRRMDFWLPDGVHPSPAGHGLIAGAWADAVLG